MRMAKNLVRKVEDRPCDFIIVQMGEKLIRSEFGFVSTCSAVQPLVVVQLDERYES